MAIEYDGVTPGSVVDPDRLSSTHLLIGMDWTAIVTPQTARVGTPGFNLAVVLVNTGGPILLDLAPLVLGFGNAPNSQLLITGATLGTALANRNGPGVAPNPATTSIPNHAALPCLNWYAQAIVFGDVLGDSVADLDPMFSNGVMGTVGAP